MGVGAPQSATSAPAAPAPSWLDAAGFAVGWLLAWRLGWKTADLVWSLWLSSLVVGYALIVWHLAGPLLSRVPQIWRDRALVGKIPASAGLRLLAMAAGGVFMLAFFTVHFGGFHFGHSLFLRHFFPLVPDNDIPPWPTYAAVWARCWVWLPVAFLAERAAFARVTEPPGPPDTAVTPAAIRRRQAQAMGGAMMAPYKNVIRMHLLIFFFVAAYFAKLENFAVYTVVYAVYFCPWAWLCSKLRRAGA